MTEENVEALEESKEEEEEGVVDEKGEEGPANCLELDSISKTPKVERRGGESKIDKESP